MEVHAHTHPSSSSGHRKKWTHYFWEFLMLFLAVFCGFLAENIREHKIEQHRAKEFAKSLVSDLAIDIVTVDSFENSYSKIAVLLDSLSMIISHKRTGQVKGGQLYYYGRFCNAGTQIPWKTATLEQITYSGGLRYFKNFALVKKISEYYSATRDIDSKYETDLTRIVKATDLRNRVFDSRYLLPFTKFLIFSKSPVLDSLINTSPPLFNSDPDLLNELANLSQTRRLNINLYLNRHLPNIKQNARELIALLNDEFHLK